MTTRRGFASALQSGLKDHGFMGARVRGPCVAIGGPGDRVILETGTERAHPDAAVEKDHNTCEHWADALISRPIPAS